MVTNPKPCYLHLAHRQPRSIRRQLSTSQVRLWNCPPTSGALVFTWTVTSIWIGMWIQYVVHVTTTSGLWGTSDLLWTRRLPLTSEEALSAHASFLTTATRWCTGSLAWTRRSSNECKMRRSVSSVHWGSVTLYQEPDGICTGSRSNSGSFSRSLY